jgi:ribonuclease P protein component
MAFAPGWRPRMEEKCSRVVAPRAAGSSRSVTSHATVKASDRRTLSKSEIIRGYRSFNAILSQRHSIASRGVRCYYIWKTIPPFTCSVGFAVRNPRNAVIRNRYRRQLREAYRHAKHPLVSVCTERGIQLRCIFLVSAVTDKNVTDKRIIEPAVKQLTHDLANLAHSWDVSLPCS